MPEQGQGNYELGKQIGALSASSDRNATDIKALERTVHDGFARVGTQLDEIQKQISEQKGQSDVLSRGIAGVALVLAVIFKVPLETFTSFFHPKPPTAP